MMTEHKRTGRIPTAVYADHVLEEYANNPLISALPPIYSTKEAATLLRDKPKFNEEEKYLDGHIRVHAIARLLRSFFQPLKHHLQLEQKLSLIIRQGYIGRNPESGDFYSHLQNGYERILQGDLSAKIFDDASSTATSLSLFGCSGCGKSRTLERITKSYPQAIFHPDYNITQVTYLKLECPINGDLDELCINFFNAIDKVLHSRYSQSHGKKKIGSVRLLANMCQIANQHALGVLIIDEIQNLSEARSGGAEKMHNFFVTLANAIGVPVVQVGTHKARKFFQRTLRTARRVTGFGSLLWDRVPNDNQWSALLKQLWKYQWLQRAEPLTEQLEQTMYELTQGVMDFVVKLFVLAQARAIVTKAERITSQLLIQVFNDEFKPVIPMLEALKSGNPSLIKEFDDLLMPEVENKLLEIVQDIEQQLPVTEPKTKPTTDKAKTLLSLLQQMGIDEDIAIPMVDNVLNKFPDMPIPALINKVTHYAVKPEADKAKPSFNKVKRSEWANLPSEDLRYKFAINGEKDFYNELKPSNIILDMTLNFRDKSLSKSSRH